MSRTRNSGDEQRDPPHLAASADAPEWFTRHAPALPQPRVGSSRPDWMTPSAAAAEAVAAAAVRQATHAKIVVGKVTMLKPLFEVDPHNPRAPPVRLPPHTQRPGFVP